MPTTGVYERTCTSNISRAAKARGATGFLHQPSAWVVTARGKGCNNVIRTGIKREAMAHFNRLKKDSKLPFGRYTGASITITRDGIAFEDAAMLRLNRLP